jgi:hypothetical protein
VQEVQQSSKHRQVLWHLHQVPTLLYRYVARAVSVSPSPREAVVCGWRSSLPLHSQLPSTWSEAVCGMRSQRYAIALIPLVHNTLSQSLTVTHILTHARTHRTPICRGRRSWEWRWTRRPAFCTSTPSTSCTG